MEGAGGWGDAGVELKTPKGSLPALLGAGTMAPGAGCAGGAPHGSDGIMGAGAGTGGPGAGFPPIPMGDPKGSEDTDGAGAFSKGAGIAGAAIGTGAGAAGGAAPHGSEGAGTGGAAAGIP
jgi:hypothetical protein